MLSDEVVPFTRGNCNIVKAVLNMAMLFVNLYVNVVDSAHKFLECT